MSIPKIIHYCWFGNNPLPDYAVKCIDSWKRFCPDYEIKLWNEDSFDFSSCKYAKQAYENGKYAFVTDYVRLVVLYEYGGIYLDTDVELIKPLDPLLSKAGFAGFERGEPGPYGREFMIASGLGIGCEAKNELIHSMLNDYDGISFADENGQLDLTSCPERNTKALVKHGLVPDGRYQEINGFCFYPAAYFAPYDYVTQKTRITDDTYSIHHYAATWKSQKSAWQKFRLRVKCTAPGRLYLRHKYVYSKQKKAR